MINLFIVITDGKFGHLELVSTETKTFVLYGGKESELSDMDKKWIENLTKSKSNVIYFNITDWSDEAKKVYRKKLCGGDWRERVCRADQSNNSCILDAPLHYNIISVYLIIFLFNLFA